MKSHFEKHVTLGMVTLGLALLPLQAATYITGEIAFTGGATLNGPVSSATAISSYFGALGPSVSGPTVVNAQGSYAAIPNDTVVTFNPFTFNPQPLSAIQLWSVNVGGINYSFDLTSVSIVFQNANFLNIKGSGFAKIDDYLDTPGNWDITIAGFEGIPVFTFGSVTTVPEPSTAAFIVGASFMMFAFRRIRSRI